MSDYWEGGGSPVRRSSKLLKCGYYVSLYRLHLGSFPGSSIDYGRLLEDIRKVVKESGREDIARVGEDISKVTLILEGILGELREHRKILEEHSKILEEHSTMLKDHSRLLGEPKVIVSSMVGRAVGILERQSYQYTGMSLHGEDWMEGLLESSPT